MNQHLICVVEDNDTDYEIIQYNFKHMKSQSFVLHREENLGDGLEFINRHHNEIYAVLLDLNYPDSDAEKTMSRLPTICFKVPVIVMTSIDHKYGYQSIRLGAQDFIDKGLLSNDALNDKLLFSRTRHTFIKQLECIAFVNVKDGLYTINYLDYYLSQVLSRNSLSQENYVMFSFEGLYTCENDVFEQTFIGELNVAMKMLADDFDGILVKENMTYYLVIEDDSEREALLIKMVNDIMVRTETLGSLKVDHLIIGKANVIGNVKGVKDICKSNIEKRPIVNDY